MNTSVGEPTAPGAQRTKREAILEGALTVFARDGYRGASIDSIAATAAVSTRTIYNHFRDKPDLFATVIEVSTERVAQVQLQILEQHLTDVDDLESALTAFARDWARPQPDVSEHFALVRHLRNETEHVPPEAAQRWSELGPRRVASALADRLRDLAADGRLVIDDAERAALFFSRLVAPPDPLKHGGTPDDGFDEHVAAAVRAFLRGHLPRDPH